MSLTNTLERIQHEIEEAILRTGQQHPVKIIAVTKNHPAELISKAYNAGIVEIGENRIQEAEAKFHNIKDCPNLKKRMIGHLQSNKAGKAVKLFDTIDSIDSLKLANKISNKAIELEKNIPALLEINTSGEIQKSGFNPKDVETILQCLEVKNLDVQGLMTVGPLTDNEKIIRNSFQNLRSLLETINEQRSKDQKKLKELSMGMSGDYKIAIEEGSTMIRLGTILFGKRNY